MWALRHAPRFRLRVSNVPQTPLPQQYSSIQSALATRGGLPTRLGVLYGRPPGGEQSASFLRASASAVAGVGAGVTELEVAASDEPGWYPDVSAFVTSVAASCPRLASLALVAVWCSRLPPPAQLPNLTALTLERITDLPQFSLQALCSSILPVLSRVQTLSIRRSPDALWRRLFAQSPTTATALTTLAVDRLLTVELLRALLRKAPNLQRLQVTALRLYSSHSSSKWRVQRLEVEEACDLGMVALLPTRVEGRTVVACSSVILEVESAEVRSCSRGTHRMEGSLM